MKKYHRPFDFSKLCDKNMMVVLHKIMNNNNMLSQASKIMKNNMSLKTD